MPYHHYVSAFHLAEFTLDRSRDGRLFVFDLQNRRRWRSPVNRAGGEIGYNAAHGIPEMDSEAIERLLGRYESAAAPTLRAVIDRLSIPEANELQALLYYVGLISANNPARRAGMNSTQEQALSLMAKMMLHNPATFNVAQAECRRDGVPILGDVSYDQLKEMVESGNFSYEPPTLAHLQGLGLLVETAARLLMERKWSLLIAPTPAPEFVLSDRPVTLVWNIVDDPSKPSGQPTLPPGLSMPNTEVVVPLGRRVALLGSYEHPPSRLLAEAPFVAEVNRRIVRNASRFVYSAQNEFVYLDHDQRICSSSDLLDLL